MSPRLGMGTYQNEESMKVYTCNDHDGFWPVGTASVIVAGSEDEARELLRNKLLSMKLDPSDFTLAELDVSKRGVTVLRDGDY